MEREWIIEGLNGNFPELGERRFHTAGFAQRAVAIATGMRFDEAAKRFSLAIVRLPHSALAGRTPQNAVGLSK